MEDRRIQRAPSVYIDCPPCDFNYLREEVRYVNYVRDPEAADIHVFVTSVGTAGGTEYEISFMGRRGFSNISFDLVYIASHNDTQDENREGMVDVLKAGLMPYLNQTPISSRFSVLYEQKDEDELLFLEEDPWNYWIFEAYVGSISLGLESNQTNFNSRWGIWADRVTEEWKLRLRPYFNYTLREIRQEDEEDIRRTVKRHGFDSYALKSINDHWSVGIFGTYVTRNDFNLRHQFQINPAVEFSILPYDVATRRAITLTYQIGYVHADYFEETIFGQTQENLLNQRLQGSVSIQQPWGTLSGGVIGSHYFHDATLRRLSIFGNTSVRLTEGLSLSFNTNFQMIQDQLTLPAGDASIEDILLQQRQLATDFTFSGSIAITYTFGSDFANVVNTRF